MTEMTRSTLSRTVSLYDGLPEYIKRVDNGEVIYTIPEQDLSPATSLQQAIDIARKNIQSPQGACGLGQALTYYALKDFGPIYLHQFADLYGENAHAFLVLEMDNILYLVDVTFAQFLNQLFVFREEEEIYDLIIKYGWIELTDEVIAAYGYAITQKREGLQLPSLDHFKTATMEEPDYKLEELASMVKSLL